MKAEIIMIKETKPIILTESKFNLEKEVDKVLGEISLKRAMSIELKFEEKFNIK